jgi:hypothetical protein
MYIKTVWFLFTAGLILTCALPAGVTAGLSDTIMLKTKDDVLQVLATRYSYALITTYFKPGMMSYTIDQEGRKSRPYMTIEHCGFASDGRTLVYISDCDGPPWCQYELHIGTATPEYQTAHGGVYFSEIGEWAAAVSLQSGQFVRRGKKTYKLGRGTASKFTWYNNGQGLMFVNSTPTKGDFVYFDDEMYGPYSAAYEPVRSPDGKVAAIAVSQYDETGSELRCYVVWSGGGQAGPFAQVDSVMLLRGDPAPYFKGYDSTGIYTVQHGVKVVGGPFKSIGHYTATPDSTVVLFSAETLDDKLIFVVGSRTYGPFYSLGPVAVSSRGQRVAYACKDSSSEDQYTLVVDGKRIGQFYAIDHMAFSPDGKRFAFSVETVDRNHFVYDGAVSSGPFEHPSDIFHFPKTGPVAHIFKNQYMLRWGGKTYESHSYQDHNSIMFSPDQKKILCSSYNSLRNESYVWDGEIKHTYEAVYHHSYIDDGALQVVIYDSEDEFYKLLYNGKSIFKSSTQITDIVNSPDGRMTTFMMHFDKVDHPCSRVRAGQHVYPGCFIYENGKAAGAAVVQNGKLIRTYW